EHQQYEGLHGVRLSPAEVVPHLENHESDVHGRGVGLALSGAIALR
ncbi:MAG: hypothetical protein QG595_1941, partial [Pseudomonadota bacterium]|nr:hypothetical protein [Pseudomonadota bacterium]